VSSNEEIETALKKLQLNYNKIW